MYYRYSLCSGSLQKNLLGKPSPNPGDSDLMGSKWGMSVDFLKSSQGDSNMEPGLSTTAV